MKINSLTIIGVCSIMLLFGCKNSEKKKEINIETSVRFVLSDTGQDGFYHEEGNVISKPDEEQDFYGQDAQYTGLEPSYHDNEDGTITDLNTGLMWQ